MNQKINDNKHNVTKLIEQYADNKEFLKTLLENVDFSEITKKQYKYEHRFHNEQTDEISYPSIHYENKEQSLAENCIFNLPLSNYEDFITPEWIKFSNEKENSLVPVVLGSRKYDFLNKLLEISTKHLFSLDKDNEEYNSYRHSYEQNLLGSILNIGKHIFDLNQSSFSTQEHYEDYYKLFKNALKCFNDYLPLLYASAYKEGYIPQHEPITHTNWLEHYSKIGFVCSKKMAKKELCNELIKSSKAYSIYLDLFPQLEHDIEFKTVFTLKKAIDIGNIPVISHLSKELNFPFDKINEMINKDLKSLVINFKENYDEKNGNLSFNHDYENHIIMLNKFAKLLTSDKVHVLLNDMSLLPSFMALEPKNLKELIDKYPQLKTEALVQGLNLQECAYANNSFYAFIEKTGLTLTNNGDFGKPTNYDLLLIHKSAKYYKSLNIENNFNNITVERRHEIEKVVANLYFDMVKFNDEKEKNSAIGVYILENKVSNKDSKVNTNKVKI